jgi:AAA15 family ATPase/GTPase
MINTLTIQNFKSIRDLTLGCRRVNVFIGEPNAGKTNILEALGLFCPQVLRQLPKALRVSEPVDLFWDQNLESTIKVACDDAEISVGGALNGLTGTAFAPPGQGPQAYFRSDAQLSMRSIGQPPIPNIRYYYFHNGPAHPSQETNSLEPPFGDNIASLLYVSKDARQSSARYFQNSGFRLNVESTSRRLLVTKEVDEIFISFPYTAASETLRRMVFFNLAVDTGGGKVLAFDEPDAHAFPPFTKSFAERLALDDRGTQYFLTTHSPYMLDSLLSKTPAQDLNIVLCRMENFETKAYPLNDVQKTKLMEWSMDSFFNLDRLLEVA